MIILLVNLKIENKFEEPVANFLSSHLICFSFNADKIYSKYTVNIDFLVLSHSLKLVDSKLYRRSFKRKINLCQMQTPLLPSFQSRDKNLSALIKKSTSTILVLEGDQLYLLWEPKFCWDWTWIFQRFQKRNEQCMFFERIINWISWNFTSCWQTFYRRRRLS